MVLTRRNLIKSGLVVVTGAATAMVPDLSSGQDAVLRTGASAPSSPRAKRSPDPFTLGVASGEPDAAGMVLWTRLARDPLADDGRGGMGRRDVDVEWQLAEDPGFRRVLRSGEVSARADEAHSVHVEVDGLRAGAEYFYRFRTGGHLSPTGRTRTAPAPGSEDPLTFVLASCSHYESGYFTAYRHIAGESPDVVFHVGDYLYETEYKTPLEPVLDVRRHVGPRTTTLAGYRQRHAQYKTDEDLQAAHAAAPWVVAYDDHEVLNNWAADEPDKSKDRDRFQGIRAAAFQAYYENMPLRASARPRGGTMPLHRRLPWGDLATFHVLDTRQYRDDQACGDKIQDGCAERIGHGRTMLGRDQEDWLADGFSGSRSRWDVLAQQAFFSERLVTDVPQGRNGELRSGYNMDSWDGYTAARDRLIEAAQDAELRNLVLLTGDVHTHWAAEITADPGEEDAESVGVELVTTSISSGGDFRHPDADWMDRCLQDNPHLRYYNEDRGYVRVRLSAESLRADFRVLDYVSRRGSPVRTDASFEVQDGDPTLQRR